MDIEQVTNGAYTPFKRRTCDKTKTGWCDKEALEAFCILCGQKSPCQDPNNKSHVRVLGEEHSRYKGLGCQYPQHTQRTERRLEWVKGRGKEEDRLVYKSKITQALMCHMKYSSSYYSTINIL